MTMKLYEFKAMRNQAIAVDYAADMDISEMEIKYDLSRLAIAQIARTLGAYRPRRGPPSPFANRNAEMCTMYLSGSSLEDVGQHFGVTRERVRQILVKNGHEVRHYGFNSEKRVVARGKIMSALERREVRKAERDIRRARIREMYNAGLTYEAIRDQTGHPISLIQGDIWRTGGPSRNVLAGQTNRKLTVEDRQEIVRLYCIGASLNAIAARLNITPESARNIAYLHGGKRPCEIRQLEDEAQH